jgi:quinol-cytochrome oxidoreductase complex cytochrome b subunit
VVATVDARTEQVAAARRWLVRAALVEVAGLAATGIYLAGSYRPTAAQAWNDLGGLERTVTLALLVRRAHRWLAYLTILTTLGLAGVAIAERLGRRAVAATALPVLALAAWFTGLLLPWDQAALWSVQVGRNVSGFRLLLDDEVRFFLVGGAEVSKGTLRFWLVAHLVLAAFLAGAIIVLRSGRAPAGVRPRTPQVVTGPLPPAPAPPDPAESSGP